MSRAGRNVELVDRISGRAWLKPVWEVPANLTLISGTEVHRIILTMRGNFEVMHFQDKSGQLLMTVRLPS